MKGKRVTETQDYLMKKLWDKGWHDLRHSSVSAFNFRYGQGVTTIALQRACEDPPTVQVSAHRLLEGICKGVQGEQP